MHDPKDLDCGFVIIAPENNAKHIEITAMSIIRKFGATPMVCVMTSEASEDSESEASSLCRVVKGGTTYSSLINAALRNPQAEWTMIIISGTSMRMRTYRKYGFFTETKRDILYPVVDRKMNFVDGTVNGILFHRDAHSEVGDMPECQSLEESKMRWGYEASCRGYKFKGIVGAGLV